MTVVFVVPAPVLADNFHVFSLYENFSGSLAITMEICFPLFSGKIAVFVRSVTKCNGRGFPLTRFHGPTFSLTRPQIYDISPYLPNALFLLYLFCLNAKHNLYVKTYYYKFIKRDYYQNCFPVCVHILIPIRHKTKK